MSLLEKGKSQNLFWINEDQPRAAARFEHDAVRRLRLIVPLASVKQTLSRAGLLFNLGARLFQVSAHNIVPKFPLLVRVTIRWTHSNANDFFFFFSTIRSGPPGKFLFRAPTNSLLSPSKMGFRRLRRRKLCRLCWGTFAVNAVIDLMAPLWLLWSGITPSYRGMHLLPLGPTSPSIISCEEVMQWLEANGQVPFSPPVVRIAHTNIKLMGNSPCTDWEYICMRLECTQQVDLVEARGNFWSSPQALMVLEVIK